MIAIAVCFACCKEREKTIPLSRQQQFEQYLAIGDSLYATKTGYNAFGSSMLYFDSAMQIAQKYQDTVMLAEGVFAKGRVYDAWNKEPLKTIELFKLAAEMYHTDSNQKKREYYVRHILAHAYDKMADSANCINTLNSLLDAIELLPEKERLDMKFIPQMAHISTVVHNYALAEKILKAYPRKNILNDPETYNFEDYYYMTKSRTGVFYYKQKENPYVDSLVMSLKHIKNPIDSLFYLKELVTLYEQSGHYKEACKYNGIMSRLNDNLSNDEANGSLQNRLLNIELENQRQKLQAEKDEQRNRRIILGMLTVGICIGIGFLIYTLRVSKRYKQQSQRLATLNHDMTNIIDEVQLLNKEIQHRVKNNLQLIFSLLNMQERKSDNPDTIENLQKAKLRIESIAGLHDQLSKNNNQNVDFNVYTHQLVQTIVACIETEHKVITNLDIRKITVPHNYYFSIGLILNEWITNSVKYANTSTPLVLNIKMLQQGNSIDIEYFDNGKVNTNDHKANGLGKEIILLLSQQMKGKLTYPPNNPYHYFLTIQNEQ